MHSILQPHAIEDMFGRRYHVRAPPQRRHEVEPPSAAPCITLTEGSEAYKIVLQAPDESFAIQDVQAMLSDDANTLAFRGLLVKQTDGNYTYVSRTRAGVYAEPHKHALVGVLPAGQTIRGGAPTRFGWIALNDDESWMYDDGSLVCTGRPAPSRSMAFNKKVALSLDADLRRATSEPRRDGRGGLVVTVPRTRCQTSAVPIQVKRSPLPQAAQARPKAMARPEASRVAKLAKSTARAEPPSVAHTNNRVAPSLAGHASNRSNDEIKQQHKRHSGMHAALAALQGDNFSPLLRECKGPEVSDRNVQSPVEETEEWHATACGGFARGGHASAADAMVCEVEVYEVPECQGTHERVQGMNDPESGEDNELSYWGFFGVRSC